MGWTFYNASGQRLSTAATSINVLDIDGATDIGAAIVDADLFIIDDGAGGTNRKTAASRIKTYIGGSTFVSGEYTGDGATSLNITGLGMTPKWVKIFLQGLSDNENVQSWETTPEILNDITDGTAIRHNASTYQTEINTIIGLSSGYFTVDSNNADEHPNVDGGKYNYIAIG